MPSSVDSDVQSIYNELNSRGVFKSDSEARAIGHELRTRGLVSDATQGGLVPPQSSTAATLPPKLVMNEYGEMGQAPNVQPGQPKSITLNESQYGMRAAPSTAPQQSMRARPSGIEGLQEWANNATDTADKAIGGNPILGPISGAIAALNPINTYNEAHGIPYIGKRGAQSVYDTVTSIAQAPSKVAKAKDAAERAAFSASVATRPVDKKAALARQKAATQTANDAAYSGVHTLAANTIPMGGPIVHAAYGHGLVVNDPNSPDDLYNNAAVATAMIAAHVAGVAGKLPALKPVEEGLWKAENGARVVQGNDGFHVFDKSGKYQGAAPNLKVANHIAHGGAATDFPSTTPATEAAPVQARKYGQGAITERGEPLSVEGTARPAKRIKTSAVKQVVPSVDETSPVQPIESLSGAAPTEVPPVPVDAHDTAGLPPERAKAFNQVEPSQSDTLKAIAEGTHPSVASPSRIPSNALVHAEVSANYAPAMADDMLAGAVKPPVPVTAPEVPSEPAQAAAPIPTTVQEGVTTPITQPVEPVPMAAQAEPSVAPSAGQSTPAELPGGGSQSEPLLREPAGAQGGPEPPVSEPPPPRVDTAPSEPLTSKPKGPDLVHGSINIGKLTSEVPEELSKVQQWYVDRAAEVGKRERVTDYEIRQGARELGLTADALAALPVGWKPSEGHLAMWTEAVRQTDQHVANLQTRAERAFAADPTPENKASLDSIEDLHKKTAERRAEMAHQSSRSLSIHKGRSHPFQAAEAGDLFKPKPEPETITKTEGKPAKPRTRAEANPAAKNGQAAEGKKLRTGAPERVKDPNFGIDNKFYTRAEADAATNRLNDRFKKAKPEALVDCKD